MTDDLACAMYLLAHDAAAEGPYDRSRTALLVRASAVVDLALRGVLHEDHGTVAVSGPTTTGSPVLDLALRDAAEGHGWRRLVRGDRLRTLAEVEDQLVRAGILVVTEPGTRRGARRSRLADPSAADAVRARVFTALHGNGPVQDVPAADAALLALASAGRVRTVVSRRDRKVFRDRIDACTSRLAAPAPGLERAVRALPTTMVAAQGGMGGN
ncbi:GPP34 family phosphoprotein [Streptomyces sp. NPDC046928]|uniref:GPP34 family phosphoprotein n=1 Tax=Streptomyces sp. NPDC046928 TaxID=3155021 RepID=UPI0033F8A259